MDLVKIAAGAAAECIRQHVGLDRVAMLIEGYALANKCKAEGDFSLAAIMNIAGIVEPTNEGQFRNIPVTFANGGGSVNVQSIPRAMVMLFMNVDSISAADFTRDFLYIHPLSDGNGRTGWIIYNWLNDTMDSPVPLPDFFGE